MTMPSTMPFSRLLEEPNRADTCVSTSRDGVGCVVFAEFVRIDVTVILVVVIFLQDGLQLEAAGFVKFAGRQVLLGPFGFDEKLFAAEFAHGFKQPGDHFAADAVPAVAA